MSPEIRLFNEDCMHAMRRMKDNEFSLAIVDPPYGIDFAAKNIKGETVRERHGWQIYDTKMWDEAIPTKEYWDELLRVSENQIVWGGNYFTEFLRPSRCWVIWYKIPYEFTLSQAEMAWCSFDSRVRVFERMTNEDRGFLGKNIHPTQKPVRLYEWLLQNYAKPRDRILDTHGGSGSICIACDILGFDLDWYEIDADYFQAAKERLERHQRQQVLDLK